MNDSVTSNKTKVFIGSSSEGKPFAEQIRIHLEEEPSDLKVILWSDPGDVFGINEHYLESLEKSLNEFHAAILIFTDDDFVISRDKELKAPRDNVIFELGLFLGKLGRDNVFFTTTKNVKIPSDLDGITKPNIDWSKNEIIARYEKEIKDKYERELAEKSTEELEKIQAKSNEESKEIENIKSSDGIVEIKAKYKKEIDEITAKYKKEIEEIQTKSKKEIEEIETKYKKEILDELSNAAKNGAATEAANQLKLALEEIHKNRLKLANEPDTSLYAIAWEGMEDAQLYKDADMGPREFLLVRGSLENLPSLAYRHSGAPKNKDFVNIVCDIEFLKGYWDSGRIEMIDKRFSDQSQRLVNQILVDDAEELSADFRYGIPIRFGFQEILVRRDRVKNEFLKIIDSGEISYELLEIENLLRYLKPNCRLGLWDVPQPTLCLMAALGFTKNKEEPSGFWKQVFERDTMQNQLYKNISLLINSKRWGFLSNPSLVRQSLIEGKNDKGIGIVLGAGSWALKYEDIWNSDNKEEKGKVSLLLPSEGVLTWVDCAAVMPIGDDPSSERKYELIRHWLKTSVQLEISGAVGGIRACPVTKDAIQIIIDQKDDKIKHPSKKTLMRYIDSDPGETLEFPLRIAPRTEHRELWNCLAKKNILKNRSQ